jgi:hypothetical protein
MDDKQDKKQPSFFGKARQFINENIRFDITQFYRHIGSREKVKFSPLFNLGIYDEEIKKGFEFERDEQVRALIKQAYVTISTRRALFEELNKIRGHYLTETILDVIYDDGISGNKNSEIFNVKFVGDAGEKNNKEIQKVIDDFIEKNKLRQLIKDISKPTMHFGEYLLRLEVDVKNKQKGVMAIWDDADILATVPVYKGQDLVAFLRSVNGKPEKMSKHSHLYFCMDDERIRMYEDSRHGYPRRMKEYIKVGKSIFFSSMNQIKQLNMIEMSNLALDVKKIVSPILVMLGVPDNTNTKEAIEIANHYESHLNDIYRTLGTIEDLDFKDVLARSARIKVLLNYGNNKGSIDTLLLDRDKESNRQKEEDIKRSIALAVGIPPYYVLGEGGQQKLESLKIYSRYSHKLNTVQNTFCIPLQNLIYLHLLYSGYNVEKKNIQVNMQQITNIEMMDDMEWIVAMSTAQGDFARFLQEVSQMPGLKLNTDEYLVYLKRFMKELPNAENLIEEGKDPPPDPGWGGDDNPFGRSVRR